MRPWSPRGRRVLPLLAALSIPFSPGHYQGSSTLPSDDGVPVEARILAPTAPEAVVATDPKLRLDPQPVDRAERSAPLAVLLAAIALAVSLSWTAAPRDALVAQHAAAVRVRPTRGPPARRPAPVG